MRTRAAAALLAVTVLTVAWARAANAVEPGFSDVICPEATQYVLSVGKLRSADPPEKIYPVAQAAVDAYARCSKDKLANGYREAQHYADTRGAGFAVVAARSLIAMKRYDDARRELERWRPLAQQVVDWQTETQAPYTAHRPNDMDPGPVASGADHRASMYRPAAKDVVAAIDAALAQLDSAQRDVSRPQAQPSAPPVPHP
jgi:hypothetical protein